MGIGELTLPEQALLLACASGSMHALVTASLDRQVAAACLCELIVRERIVVVQRMTSRVSVVDRSSTGDPDLDRAIAEIAATKEKGAGHWLSRLSRWALDAYAQRLADAGLLDAEESRGRLLRRAKIAYRARPGVTGAIDEQVSNTCAEPSRADLASIALVLLLAHTGFLFLPLERVSPAEGSSFSIARDRSGATRHAKELERRYPESTGRDASESEALRAACRGLGEIAQRIQPDGA